MNGGRYVNLPELLAALGFAVLAVLCFLAMVGRIG